MGVPQIPNPAVAFSSAGQDNIAQVSTLVMELPVGTTVLVNQVVILTYSLSTGEYSIAPAAAASAASAIGVTTIAGGVGTIVPVIVYGPAFVASGATLATGVICGVGATGAIAAASATIGSNIGFMLATCATGATAAAIYVAKT